MKRFPVRSSFWTPPGINELG
ncbi:rCG21682 [Rattus norvegicus]|uniref:RCG21682 n=1 Tax=Rattus norvegicus TaxID=10116 RepID=A6J1U3_RAT|nr:rCG21682 [Rattus norvegicus]